MAGFPDLSYLNLPGWLTLIVLTVYFFRQQIGSFIPTAIREHFQNRAQRRADWEEFEQEITATELDHRLQTAAAEQLAEARREERLLTLVEKKDAWIQGTLQGQMERLLAGQDRSNELLAAIQETLARHDL